MMQCIACCAPLFDEAWRCRMANLIYLKLMDVKKCAWSVCHPLLTLILLIHFLCYIQHIHTVFQNTYKANNKFPRKMHPTLAFYVQSQTCKSMILCRPYSIHKIRRHSPNCSMTDKFPSQVSCDPKVFHLNCICLLCIQCLHQWCNQ